MAVISYQSADVQRIEVKIDRILTLLKRHFNDCGETVRAIPNELADIKRILRSGAKSQ